MAKRKTKKKTAPEKPVEEVLKPIEEVVKPVEEVKVEAEPKPTEELVHCCLNCEKVHYNPGSRTYSCAKNTVRVVIGPEEKALEKHDKDCFKVKMVP